LDLSDGFFVFSKYLKGFPMQKFETLINKMMNESVIDIARDDLDPTVFTFKDGDIPIIKPSIRSQVINDVSMIHEITPVLDYYVVGSILTKRYSKVSDIDVNVVVDPVTSPMVVEAVVKLIKRLNGTLAVGTTHPINYYIYRDENAFDTDNTPAIYDIANERWIKEPEEDSFSVRAFMKKFEVNIKDVDLSTAELRRDLLDFKELDELSDDEVKDISYLVKNKVAEIEESVENLISIYKDYKNIRRKAYKEPMTPKQIRAFGGKYNLPENIQYKLLEKYYYIELVTKLEKIMSDGKLTKDEIPTVKKAVNDFLKV
jgi:predicted nucleotidyltransferase